MSKYKKIIEKLNKKRNYSKKKKSKFKINLYYFKLKQNMQKHNLKNKRNNLTKKR